MDLMSVAFADSPVTGIGFAVVHASDGFEARQKVRRACGVSDAVQLRVSHLVPDGQVLTWRATQ